MNRKQIQKENEACKKIEALGFISQGVDKKNFKTFSVVKFEKYPHTEFGVWIYGKNYTDILQQILRKGE